MYTIIGLGAAGCNIAEMFENEGYKVKLIDVDIEGDNCFSLQKQKLPEDYEKHVPNLSDFFKDVTDKVILVVGGSGKISGSSLKILQQLKHKEINVLYIRPDVQLLGTVGKLQDKLTFNVFQEYARSGMFKNTFIISNPVIESIVGDMPITQYNEVLNRVIYNCLSSYLNLETQQTIIDNSSQPKDSSRIVTFGVYDLENNNEKMLYPFNFVDDKCYNFYINENELKTNGKLFRLIKERMREKVLDNLKISYRIYSTAQEQNYCYVTVYSKNIQE